MFGLDTRTGSSFSAPFLLHHDPEHVDVHAKIVSRNLGREFESEWNNSASALLPRLKKSLLLICLGSSCLWLWRSVSSRGGPSAPSRDFFSTGIDLDLVERTTTRQQAGDGNVDAESSKSNNVEKESSNANIDWSSFVPNEDYETQLSRGAFGPAPDYSKNDAWYWRGQDGSTLAEIVVTGDPDTKLPAAERPCDAFYIHPTTYFGGKLWNMSIVGEESAAFLHTTEWYITTDASVFNGQCRVFAPKFRQATWAFTWKRESGRKALEFAYGDVKRAFLAFLEENKIRKRGSTRRPIVTASHSQGSILHTMLLQEFFEGKPLKQNLVAAYAMAAWLPLSFFYGSTVGQTHCDSDTNKSRVFADLRLSQKPDDVGVMVSYTTEDERTVLRKHDAAKRGLVSKDREAEEENWYPTSGHKILATDEWRHAAKEATVGTNVLSWTTNAPVAEKGNQIVDGRMGSANGRHLGSLRAIATITSEDGKNSTLTMDQLLASFYERIELPGRMQYSGFYKVPANSTDFPTLSLHLQRQTHVDLISGDLSVPRLPSVLAGHGINSYEHMNYMLWYYNLRENLAERVAAWYRRAGENA